MLLLEPVGDIKRVAALDVDHEHVHAARFGLTRDDEVRFGRRRRRLRLLAGACQRGAQLVGFARPLAQERVRLPGRDRLDPARSRTDGALGEDHERPDLGRRPHVGPATELAGEAVDLDHAHDVAVLLAEQHLGTELPRLVNRRLEDPHRMVREHLLVDDPLDLVALLRSERAVVREVEAKLVGPHRRARLLDVLAEDAPQRLVEEMRRRVVRHRREPDRPRNDRAHAVARGEALSLQHQDLVVPDQPLDADELGPVRAVVLLQIAGIPHLAAAVRVERRLSELRLERPVASVDESADLREDIELLVPDEVGLEGDVADQADRNGDGGARALALLLHQLRVATLVDRHAALERELPCQLDREPVRVVQLERCVATERRAARKLVEDRHPARQRPLELLLLGLHDALDVGRVRLQLGEGVAHLLDDDIRQAPELVEPDRLRLLNRAADHPPEDIAAALVRGLDAVGDEKRHATSVVGQYPVGLRRLLGLAEGDAALLCDPVHDRLVAVGLVHGANVLDDRREPLEPHARVDVLLRQRRQRSVLVLLVLHEDEVPELEVAVTAGTRGRAAGIAAAVLWPPVPVDLRVRSARPRPAHRPEVLGARERDDPLRRYPDRLPFPDRDLVRPELEDRVAGVHRHPDAIPVQLQAVLDEIGRVLDRACLEVLPEREVAEHLEERQVMSVAADLVDVLGAEALLRGAGEQCGRLLAAEEVRHLRLHPGGREQRRMVVRAGDERPRRQPLVTLLLEVGKEAFAQLGRRSHPGILGAAKKRRASARMSRTARRSRSRRGSSRARGE